MTTKHIILILIAIAAIVSIVYTGTNDQSDPASQNTTLSADEQLRLAAAEGTPVAFFYASWCPTCRSLKKELQERADEIPEGIVVVTLNYDDEKDLRRRYNVIHQHTLVLLDENLNATKTWVGGGVDNILAQIAG